MLSHKPREIHRLLNESGPLASPSGRERVSRIRVIVAALDDVAKAMNIASLKLHSAGFHTVALSVPDGGSATRLYDAHLLGRAHQIPSIPHTGGHQHHQAKH